ncbi:MAG TPA: ATP-binding cassette domain-containing protein [Solirubrobacteraceae bacterium]|jgi:putative ABC transport system ATP-binding protein|nr:ATP-binding cassette domain-containing protein [Solirubrobacteraceae bacterium]
MLLHVERVTKRYPRPTGEKIALDDVSLTVDRGQILGIFGPSGSGKSTLLRVAAGLLSPDSGSVIYNGERLDSMSSTERSRFRRREIACVWSGALIPDGLSVVDHVAVPLLIDSRDHRAAERRAREALLACEVEHCSDLQMEALSDGERERASIARALATEPRLLLADGPASRLSLIEQEQIMVLLASLAEDAKVAVLVTDSNADALLRCDPVLYLNEGKFASSAQPVQLGRVYPFPARPAQSAADA